MPTIKPPIPASSAKKTIAPRLRARAPIKSSGQSLEPLGERNREHEREQDLGAGNDRTKFVEQLLVLSIEPIALALTLGRVRCGQPIAARQRVRLREPERQTVRC